MKRFNTIDEIKSFVGQEVGPGPWRTVTQKDVDLFAEATGDHQWIHTDPERARRESPFGGPVAHGFLTLSLLPVLMAEVVDIHGPRLKVNYGLNRVRFTAPVPVGQRVRLRAAVKDVAGDGQPDLTVTWQVVVELEGSDKPVCVAESIAKFHY